MERVCERLGVCFGAEARRTIGLFVDSITSYEKNEYQLSGAERALIRSTLREHYERLGYS